jgi:hypothetical protein
MAIKAGRKQRNPEDIREKRQTKGTRTTRRQGTKSRAAKRGYRR